MGKKSSNPDSAKEKQEYYLTTNFARFRAAERVASALHRGLTEFAGREIRVALLLCLKREEPLFVYDPADLLGLDKKAIEKQYRTSQSWREVEPPKRPAGLWTGRDLIYAENDLKSDQFLDFYSCTSSAFVQHWVVERHISLGTEQIIMKWIMAASLKISHDLDYDERLNNSGSSATIVNFAETAALRSLYERQQCMHETNSLQMVDPQTVLQAAVRLSSALEESKRSSGSMWFIHESEIEFWLSSGLVFSNHQDLPKLSDTKHARKLLTLCGTKRALVSDGKHIRGVVPRSTDPPKNTLLTEFSQGRVTVKLGEHPWFSVVDGKIKPFAPKIDLDELRKQISQMVVNAATVDQLVLIVEEIVQHARAHTHGCTICIDFSEPTRKLKGEYLSAPLDAKTNMDLVESAAEIDGAVHLSGDGHLLGFACLFDGSAVEKENRARGARYNSALRFSRENQSFVIVVASEDGFLNIFHQGPLAEAAAERDVEIQSEFKNFDEWLEESNVPSMG